MYFNVCITYHWSWSGLGIPINKKNDKVVYLINWIEKFKNNILRLRSRVEPTNTKAQWTIKQRGIGTSQQSKFHWKASAVLLVFVFSDKKKLRVFLIILYIHSVIPQMQHCISTKLCPWHQKHFFSFFNDSEKCLMYSRLSIVFRRFKNFSVLK
jgi:hypothetical protein